MLWFDLDIACLQISNLIKKLTFSKNNNFEDDLSNYYLLIIMYFPVPYSHPHTYSLITSLCLQIKKEINLI